MRSLKGACNENRTRLNRSTSGVLLLGYRIGRDYHWLDLYRPGDLAICDGATRCVMSRSNPIIVMDERQCSYCGSWFKSEKTGRSVVCDECHELRKRDQQKEYQARRRYSYRSGHSVLIGYHVVLDPDPDPSTRYPTGAVFPKEEVRLMLTSTCVAFTPGTILADPQDNRFVVVSRPNGALKIKPWQNDQTQIKS